MANFDAYIPLLLKVEAKLPPRPEGKSPEWLYDYATTYGWTVDSGGPTMCGVTLKAYQRRYGRDKTSKDLQRLPFQEWRTIMKADYWDKMKADGIRNQSCAELLVDWVVNSGEAVIRKVQDLVCVDVDGIVGPITLNAINMYRAECLHCRVLSERRAYYERIVQADPSKTKYLKGWLARLDNFKFSD